MPLYEYKCPSGHLVEHVFKAGTAPETIACGEYTGDPKQPVCLDHGRRVYSKPMVPILDPYDAHYRRRRRPNPADELPV